jgi:DMSO/TMAO reductase YedYZ molybdopterin-dependent catalytic subunit
VANATAITVDGLVDRPTAYDADGLSALPGQVPDVSALVPDREGVAVSLAAVLDSAGVSDDARFITINAEAGYSASVPLEAVRDQAILIYKLGDGPLPRDKGGPVRFFIPDVAACQTDEVDQCANVKYVESIVLSAVQGADTRPGTIKQHIELHLNETS